MKQVFSRMRGLIFFGVAAAFCCGLKAKTPDRLESLKPVPDDQPIPVIDFFRPPAYLNPKINPSGTLIAGRAFDKSDSANLAIMNLVTKKVKGLGGGRSFDVNSFQWLNDSRLMFRVSKQKLYSFGLYSVEATKLDESINLTLYDVAIPIGIPRKDPLHPIVWIKNDARSDGKDGGAMQIDATLPYEDGNGWSRKRYPIPRQGTVLDYFSDVDGELSHVVTTKDGVHTLSRLEDGNKWVTCLINMDEFSIEDTGEKPGELIGCYHRTEEASKKPAALYRMDDKTGKPGEILYQDDQYDPTPVDFYRDRRDGRILGIILERKGPEVQWLDPEFAVLQASLEKALPNLAVRILNSDTAKKKFIVCAGSDTQPDRYLLLERDANKLHKIGETRPWINPQRMAPMKHMTYKARDGLPIEGYFSAPELPEGKLPPLVVLPHGGPWARSYWGWDEEVQFLVSRGYAVFQPNYRGSPGTSWRFSRSDMWDFIKMHNDVTDGVKALIRSKLVDPNRIAIMGASFGGYLAVCGAAFEKDLYRCAITIAGVFDWERVVKDAKGSEVRRGAYGFLKRRLGDPKTEKKHFDEISPIRFTDQIKIPIFVAHGREDKTADFSESKRLVRALKDRKIPNEVMFEDDEGHGFHHLENKVELYARIEAFLAKYLAPTTAKQTPK